MAKAKAASANDNPDNHIQILKEATCPTSSGKSTLGYQIGINDKGAIHLKVSSNDGGGFFSNEWIAFNDIQAALAEWPEDQGVTSMAFLKIFRGKSSNTPGFLIAVLVAEGLLEPMADKKRVHQACDSATFLASVAELEKDTGITGGRKPAAKAKSKARAKTAPKAKAKTATKRTAKTPRKTKRVGENRVLAKYVSYVNRPSKQHFLYAQWRSPFRQSYGLIGPGSAHNPLFPAFASSSADSYRPRSSVD